MQVCQALNTAGARYLVIGGVACILHGYVRATTDLDVLIERTPDNAGLKRPIARTRTTVTARAIAK
ncbi:MAG: hypothetical protein H0T86_16255 [Gemmatimonadales bacterium]|nr:hypothetical protein [Gemmatimonadales bacterium]